MKKHLLKFLFLILFLPNLYSQSASLPLLSHGKTELSLNMQAGFNQQYKNDDRLRLYEVFGRFGMGFNNLFDVYGLVGTVKQNIRFGDNSISNFDSELTAAYGGGLAISWPYKLPGDLKLTTTGQMTLFTPTGASYSRSTVPNTNYRRRHDFDYDWLRIQAAGFLSKKRGHYEFFIGGHLQSEEVEVTRSLTLESDEGEFFLSQSKSLYKNTRQPYLSVGLNVELPGRHQFGVELRGGTGNEFALFLAIGQTGSP